MNSELDLELERLRNEFFREMQDCREPIERPDWDSYYMGLAFMVKERSADGQTKHGCVITTKNYEPLSLGYNSFPRKMRDNELPNIRKSQYAPNHLKYEFIIHSEENAVANCLISPKILPNGPAQAYITGLPCNGCAKTMWQNGIGKWFLAQRQGTVLENHRTKFIFETILDHTGIEIILIPTKDSSGRGRLNWMKSVISELEKIGYID
jgi:dCMP deaminase